MKILLLTAYYYPRIGGVEYVVRETVKEFKRRGHQVTIITRKHDSKLRDEELVDGITVKRIPHPRGWKGMWRIWLWLFKNRKLIKQSDLVDCENISPFYWYLPFRFIYPRKPVFAVFYGYEYPIRRRMVFLRKLAEKLATDHICGGTYLEKYYGTPCERVVYPIVDMNHFRPGRKDNNRACFIGRLHEDTNMMGYLKAVKILKDKYGIKLKLDICGDGEQRKELESFAKKNRLDAVFHGLVKNPEKYYKASSIAFSSTAGVTLEAMASKCLVFHLYSNEIVKDLIESLTQKKDIISITRNPEELAKKMSSLYNNPKEAGKITERAYQFVKKFNSKTVADVFIGMYGGKKPEGIRPFS
jgi:glycosyltransferase involved in cell wall biosynthesis